MPDLSGYPTVKVYDTFVDGSHIIGAIELLIRNCDTTRFLILHDSMFLLKALPSSILDRIFYSLWHFNEQSRYFYSNEIEPFVKSFRIPENERLRLTNMFRQNPTKEWNGIFGPAFGGTIEMLRIMWLILNITEKNVSSYLGRHGLMASERVLAIICMYMGFNTEQSLNGNIYKHPNAFNATAITDYASLCDPNSFFYKVWKNR